MSKIAVVNFNSGEVSSQTDAREDIEKYTGGCRKLENMIPDVFGNSTRRPGTEYITTGGAGCYYETPVADPAKTQITTPQELQNMADDLTDDYEIMNAIDMTGFSWTPIGDATTPFEGSLDGNYFTISNLTMVEADAPFIDGTNKGFGLFGFLGKAGATVTVENLRLNIAFNGDGTTNSPVEWVGGLAAKTDAGTALNITQVDVTGTIEGATGDTGGLIGRAHDVTITRCRTDVDINILVTGSGNNPIVGGLIGFAIVGQNIEITDSYAIGDITIDATTNGSPSGGGFIGLEGNRQQPFSNCYASGDVNVDGLTPVYSGGFIGHQDAAGASTDSSFSCFSFGAVTGSSINELFVGGFYGKKDAATPTQENDHFDRNRTGQAATTNDTATAQNTNGVDPNHFFNSSSDIYTAGPTSTWDFDTVWEIVESVSLPTLQWLSEIDKKLICIWIRD